MKFFILEPPWTRYYPGLHPADNGIVRFAVGPFPSILWVNMGYHSIPLQERCQTSPMKGIGEENNVKG
jgi:hypothetical protein